MSSILTRVVNAIKREGYSAIPRLAVTAVKRLPRWKEIKEDAAKRAEHDKLYDAWIRKQMPDAEERKKQGEAEFRNRVSFLIPVYNTRVPLLDQLADSFLQQTCPLWEVCFYDGMSTDRDTIRRLDELAQADPRFRVVHGEKNLGIAGNTNEALKMARYSYIALCDHDDLVTPDAVYCLLYAAEHGADFIYSDEDKCDEKGESFFGYHLKEDFAPDTLNSGNYICHLMCMKRTLMEQLGGLDSRCDGSQDHDLALRLSEHAEHIVHIPRVLYHWRMLNTSFSHESFMKCVQSSARAIEGHLQRIGQSATVVVDDRRPRVHYAVPADGTVSLVVLCNGKGLDRWLRKTIGKENRLIREVLLVNCTEGYNFDAVPVRKVAPQETLAMALNKAGRAAAGNYLCFVTQGMVFSNKKWVEELVSYARRSDVGCVGAPIWDRVEHYLHCGFMVDTPKGAVSQHKGMFRLTNTYELTDRIVHNVTAVSACLTMIRREKFTSVGGFLPFDSDLMGAAMGLSLQAQGYRNVITPYAAGRLKRDVPALLTAEPTDKDLAAFEKRFGAHPEEKYVSSMLERVSGRLLFDPQAVQPTVESLFPEDKA